MTNRYEVRSNGQIIDTKDNHRFVGEIVSGKDGRRYLGDVEVTKIWSNREKLNAAVEAHMARS